MVDNKSNKFCDTMQLLLLYFYNSDLIQGNLLYSLMPFT